MNPDTRPLLLAAGVSFACSALVAFAVASSTGSPAAAGEPPAAAPDADLAAAVGDLRRAVEAQERAITDLRLRLSGVEAAPRTAAVAPPPVAEPDERAAAPTAEPDAGALSAESAVERLVADDFATDEERERFWQAVRDAGLMDQVLADFRARAEARPNDPEAQLDLGVAYIQALQAAAGPMAGMLASKADAAFDAALALDEDHLEARMWKAMSLSFWPPVFGKQSEAIHEFEVLIEKQQNYPHDPQHAQAYLLLGNLHLQQGDQAEALAVWKSGLELYPDAQALLEQIQLSGQD